MAVKITADKMVTTKINLVPYSLIRVSSVILLGILFFHSILYAEVDLTKQIPESYLDRDIILLPEDPPWTASYLSYLENPLIAKEGALEKYLEILLAKKLITREQALESLQWERDHHSYETIRERPFWEAMDWRGHCNGLATAGLTFVYPKKSVSVDGIELTVAEQVSLAIETSNQTRLRMLGDRTYAEGDPRSPEKPSGQEDDENRLDALKFHQYVIKYIGQHKVSFVIDNDPEIPVMNRVVKGAVFYFQKSEEDIFVTLDLVLLPYLEYEEVLDGVKKPAEIKTLYYRLKKDPLGVIYAAEWTQSSWFGENIRVSPRIEQRRRQWLESSDDLQFDHALPRSLLKKEDFEDNKINSTYGFSTYKKYRQSHVEKCDSYDDLPDFLWYPVYINDFPPEDQRIKNPICSQSHLRVVLPHLFKQQ